MFQGCWKHKHAKQEVDRHANMNQISIRKRQSRKTMRQLSASQYTISIMLILFAVNISRSLQARLWRRRRAHRAVMTFPKHSPIPECSPCRLPAAASHAAMQPSNPSHVDDERGPRQSAHGLSHLPSPEGTPPRLQCRRGRPGLRLEG